MAKRDQSSFFGKSLENSVSRQEPRLSFRSTGCPLLFLVLCFLTPRNSHAQSHDVVCRDGDGEFQAESAASVKVHVGPAISEGLAARVCAASLEWPDQKPDQKIEIASSAAELDLDAFGVDFGIGAPAAAFQVKNSKTDCCMAYEIYSLRAPPLLLRRIGGGAYFSAADTDLDGRIEIWTDDAAAVEGFENLRLRDLDFPPPVVLRFARPLRLLDASAEFKPYFDEKIAQERARANPEDLANFKASDGKLSPAAGLPPARLSRLRNAKMHVLEIVWCYLYSGREQEAWRSLTEMWPAADLERIRTALVNARAHGILSQVDGVSRPVRRGRENHVKIFDGTTYTAATPGVTPKNVKPKPEIVPPRAILMERQPPMTPIEIELSKSESTLVLVIDSAGKVRSVEQMGNTQAVDAGLLKSTVNWKFIPAFDNGLPVASRILLGVSLRR